MATAQKDPSTPVKRSSAATSQTSEAGPSRRPTVHSPAYISRRHSLYGIEDRVVIDPGSRVWKVGFSGEPDPRAVFWASPEGRTRAPEIWDLDLSAVAGARGSRSEGRRLVSARVQRRLRDVFHRYLNADGKARKVIVVESTFMPNYVKEEIARVLFDNLRVPSVAFTPASLLSLAACGRITGLVVDCGWLETTITPVYSSRPLYHLARSTPVAGRVLFTRLRALLHHFGRYYPPSSSAAENPPLDILTDHLVERVLTEACYVESEPPRHESMSTDMELSITPPDMENGPLMSVLEQRYGSNQAVDWTIAIPSSRGIGPNGKLIVPGWVRARTAEVLFNDGPDEDETLPELVLNALEKLPLDLRHDLSSSILVTGGTASLPGLIPRLKNEIFNRLPTSPPSDTRDTRDTRNRQAYASLIGLRKRLSILNDPAPFDGEGNKGGSAPRWTPSLVPWIGGSLAGVLKTGGPEIVREDYDSLISESVALGEDYVAQIKEERERFGQVMAAVGLGVDELAPGMAVAGLDAKRKRGWRPSAIPDWSTGGVHA